MNAAILWILAKVLPAKVFGLNTAVLLGGAAKIKAVVDLLKQAGMDEKDAKAAAAVATAKEPTLPADILAQKAWEDRGMTSGQ